MESTYRNTCISHWESSLKLPKIHFTLPIRLVVFPLSPLETSDTSKCVTDCVYVLGRKRLDLYTVSAFLFSVYMLELRSLASLVLFSLVFHPDPNPPFSLSDRKRVPNLYHAP